MATARRVDGLLTGEPARRLVAIAAGGALGTLARYGVDRSLVAPPFGFPWATFTVNMTGALLLGLIVTLVAERWPPTRFVRPFAAIGFCGGYTTFSTLVVEAALLTQHGRVGPAVVYVVASVVVGLASAVLGMSLARGRLLPLLRLGPIPDPDDVGMLDSDPESGGDPLPPDDDRSDGHDSPGSPR